MLNEDYLFIQNIVCSLEREGYLFKNYSIICENNEINILGGGEYSLVFEAYNLENSKEKGALKIIKYDNSSLDWKKYHNTYDIQKKISKISENVVKIRNLAEYKIYLDKSESIEKIEPVDLGDNNDNGVIFQFILMEKLEPIIEKSRYNIVSLKKKELAYIDNVLDFAFQIGSAIDILHKNNVLHRDIKLENIFWNEKEHKYQLGDFGFAISETNKQTLTVIYTKGYGAPEIAEKKEGYYDERADIYSFGITLYLLLNELRFPSSDGYYMSKLQYDKDFSVMAPVNSFVELTKVIRKMLNYNPDNRYDTIEAVLQDFKIAIENKNNVPVDEEQYIDSIETDNTCNSNVSGLIDKESEQDIDKQKEIMDTNFTCIDHITYFILIAITCFCIMCRLMPRNISFMTSEIFILPILMLIESIFQKIEEFDIIFAIISFAMCIFLISKMGINISHIIFIVGMLCGVPIICSAIGTAWLCWMYIIAFNMFKQSFLFSNNIITTYIISAFFIYFLNVYTNCTSYYKKKTNIKIWVKVIWNNGISLFIIGSILNILQRFDWFNIKFFFASTRFIILGIVLFIIRILCLTRLIVVKSTKYKLLKQKFMDWVEV